MEQEGGERWEILGPAGKEVKTDRPGRMNVGATPVIVLWVALVAASTGDLVVAPTGNRQPRPGLTEEAIGV